MDKDLLRQTVKEVIDSVRDELRQDREIYSGQLDRSLRRLDDLEENYEVLFQRIGLIENNYITKEQVRTIINEVIQQYMTETTQARRDEIRQEMGEAIRDYLSWKRIGAFLLATIGIIEAVFRMLQEIRAL